MNKKNHVFFHDSISINYDNPLILPIGHTEFYDSVVKVQGFYDHLHSAIDVIHALIKGQSIKTPKDVNDIVDIIKLNADGTILWEEKHQECN